jgi:hypothetical protein
MSRTATSPRPFRPRLESLEGRELPATVGLLVFGLSQSLQLQVNAANTDFNRLQADVGVQVAASQFNGSSGSVAAIAPVVDGDRAVVQSDFNHLRANGFLASIVLSPALLSAVLRRRDAFAIGPAVAAGQAVSNEINSLPGQVAALGNLPLRSSPSMTVNAAQLFFGFSSLTLHS